VHRGSKTRENMRHRLKDKNNKDNLDKYRHTRNIVTSTIRKARRQCWEDFCSNLPPKINSKQLWSFIAKVKGRPPPSNPPFIVNGNIITEANEKANVLLKHYVKTSSDEGFSQEFIEQKQTFQNTLIHSLRKINITHI